MLQGYDYRILIYHPSEWVGGWLNEWVSESSEWVSEVRWGEVSERVNECVSKWSHRHSTVLVCSIKTKLTGVRWKCKLMVSILSYFWRQAIRLWIRDGRLQFTGGRFKNTYELLNQRALKFSYVNKIHIFQRMGKIFCVEFQRYPLKFHTKYLTHTLKDMIFMQFWNFKSS